jgi:hypothetical protein
MTERQVPLGNTCITRSAKSALSALDIHVALSRHAKGDWGIVDEHDRAANDRALEIGERLVSVFRSEAGDRFYVITEWDRSATTVLLPEDY